MASVHAAVIQLPVNSLLEPVRAQCWGPIPSVTGQEPGKKRPGEEEAGGGRRDEKQMTFSWLLTCKVCAFDIAIFGFLRAVEKFFPQPPCLAAPLP